MDASNKKELAAGQAVIIIIRGPGAVPEVGLKEVVYEPFLACGIQQWLGF